MPTHAVIATLPSTTSRAYTLTVGGLDVIGGDGFSYITDVETIVVEEEGPGGVSSMSFTIFDRDLTVRVDPAAKVELWDMTNSLPLFAGFVQSWAIRPAGPSRYISVRCIGVEAVLDWMRIPAAVTFAALSNPQAAMQSLVYRAQGVGVPLRAFTTRTEEGLFSGFGGTQQQPIAKIMAGAGSQSELAEAVTIDAGTTLREALVRVARTVVWPGSAVPQVGFITIDFWYGLRFWTTYSGTPADYADLTITDTPAGALAAAALTYETDASGTVRQVHVAGGNAAGTGLVTDGSGSPGPIDTISDATILTEDAKLTAGRAYLADKATGVRGGFELENYAPTTNIRPGAQVTITDAAAGLSSTAFTIASITRRFVANKQRWSVAFGGLRPSAARLTRRLTR